MAKDEQIFEDFVEQFGKRNIGKSCYKRKKGETKSKRREEKHGGKGINSRKVPRVNVRR